MELAPKAERRLKVAEIMRSISVAAAFGGGTIFALGSSYSGSTRAMGVVTGIGNALYLGVENMRNNYEISRTTRIGMALAAGVWGAGGVVHPHFAVPDTLVAVAFGIEAIRPNVPSEQTRSL